MLRKIRSNSRGRRPLKPPKRQKTPAGEGDRVERVLAPGHFLHSARTHLRALEKQLQRNQRRCGRRLNGTVHQAERQVRRLWAQRNSRARRLKLRARRDAVRVLKRLERSLQPPKPRQEGG